jgi:hypothetical protein
MAAVDSTVRCTAALLYFHRGRTRTNGSALSAQAPGDDHAGARLERRTIPSTRSVIAVTSMTSGMRNQKIAGHRSCGPCGMTVLARMNETAPMTMHRPAFLNGCTLRVDSLLMMIASLPVVPIYALPPMAEHAAPLRSRSSVSLPPCDQHCRWCQHLTDEVCQHLGLSDTRVLSDLTPQARRRVRDPSPRGRVNALAVSRSLVDRSPLSP